MKHKYTIKTLRGNLFFYQSLLILIILLVAGLCSYLYMRKTFIKNILTEQNSLGLSIAESLENELEKLNIVSMNISYSNLLKEMFKDYQQLSGVEEQLDDRIEKYLGQSLLFDSILGIMGHFHTVSQVNLYTFDGFMIGSGLFNKESKIDISGISDIQNTIKLDGYKYLSTPKKYEILIKKNLQLKDHSFISLYRVFKDQHHQNEGIVEVVQDCEKIFSSVDLKKRNSQNLKIYILNSDGILIYPYNEETTISMKDLQEIIIPLENLNTIKAVTLEGDSQEEIISTFGIEKYGLKIVLLQTKNLMLKPLRRFQLLFFIFIIFLTLYTLIVSYSVSARVTMPLNSLVNYLSGLKINNLTEELNKTFPNENTFVEIDSLYEAFNNMSLQLKTSIDELINLKDQEALTRLLTLQSQMNPHFLYNNLANIIALAEEEKNDQVIKMCTDISYMLRYSTVKDLRGTYLIDEIKYVEKYLSFMDLRYEEDLSYTITYPDKMKYIKIPRILIQPLVENSFNHGLTTEPPWVITIIGEIIGDQWLITVNDNGGGFSDEVLDIFNKPTQNIILNNHIGLENTRQRLELIYKEKAIFHISNLKSGGASITIGGNIDFRKPKT